MPNHFQIPISRVRPWQIILLRNVSGSFSFLSGRCSAFALKWTPRKQYNFVSFKKKAVQFYAIAVKCFRVCLVGFIKIRKGSEKGLCVHSNRNSHATEKSIQFYSVPTKTTKKEGRNKKYSSLETAGCTHSEEPNCLWGFWACCLETAGKRQPARRSSWIPKSLRAEPWFREPGTRETVLDEGWRRYENSTLEKKGTDWICPGRNRREETSQESDLGMGLGWRGGGGRRLPCPCSTACKSATPWRWRIGVDTRKLHSTSWESHNPTTQAVLPLM